MASLKEIAAVSLLIFAVYLVNPSVAANVDTPNLLQSAPPPCGWALNTSNTHHHGLVCFGGVLRGWSDFEGGNYVPGDPKKLNVNISAGSAVHRGYVVLTPDNGKGAILEDGHLHKLLIVRGNRYGGTEFRIRPRFKRSLIICDKRGKGCIDLYRVVKRLDVASLDTSR